MRSERAGGAAAARGAAQGAAARASRVGATGRSAGARLQGFGGRALGLGLLIAWQNVTFFSGLVHFSTRNSISHLNSTYALYCLGMGAALIVLSLPVWERRRPTGPAASAGPAPGEGGGWPAAWRRAFGLSSLVLTLCTALLAMVEARLFTQPWCSIVSTAAGAAAGALSLAWAQALLRERSRPQWAVCLAFVIGGALYLGILCLPRLVGVCLTALLPPASAAVLAWCDSGSEREGAGQAQAGAAAPAKAATAAHGAAARPGAPEPEDPVGPRPGEDGHWWAFNAWGRPGETGELGRRRARFLRAVASMLLLGMAESLERALFTTFSPLAESTADHWVLFLSETVGALAFALIVAGCMRGGREYRLNRAVTAVISFLFLLAPIVADVWLWGDVATLTCHFLFQMLVWVVLARMAIEWRLPARLCFAPGMGAASLGCLAGTFAGSVVRSFWVPTYQATSLIALLCATLAMASLLFLLDEQTLVVLTNADTERPSAPRRFGVRVDAVAAAHGLTARETQVLMLVAKGRTTQRIQEELGISAGTVNTHLDHLYKKLDVHDRQQLLDLLEEAGRRE